MPSLMISLLLSIFADTVCNAQVKFPPNAPMQTLRQEFGLGHIELIYTRPGANKRRVFGDLVPYGKIWGTGEGAVTSIYFSTPVEVNTRRLDSGTYLLYTIPGEEQWEIIFNKGLDKKAGIEGYQERADVLRFKTEPVKTKIKTETFTIHLADVQPERCELQLVWEKRLITIPIVTNVKDNLRRQLDAAMKGDKKPYWEAARFYNEYEKNYNRALEMVNKALELQPTAFWMFLYKAKIQQETGNIAGATESATNSLYLAKQNGNADYIRMNEALLKALKKAAKK